MSDLTRESAKKETPLSGLTEQTPWESEYGERPRGACDDRQDRECATDAGTAGRFNGNGAGVAGQGRPQRPRKVKSEADEFVADIEGPPALVDNGVYEVKVKRLERWEFPRGKKGERQPKITFHCVIFGGPFNNTELVMRMNYDLPIRRSSKIWETITIATRGYHPTRASRISLRRLFLNRVFRAEVKTLESPHRQRNWAPVLGQDDKPVIRCRASVIDHFIEACTGPDNDYLL